MGRNDGRSGKSQKREEREEGKEERGGNMKKIIFSERSTHLQALLCAENSKLFLLICFFCAYYCAQVRFSPG